MRPSLHNDRLHFQGKAAARRLMRRTQAEELGQMGADGGRWWVFREFAPPPAAVTAAKFAEPAPKQSGKPPASVKTVTEKGSENRSYVERSVDFFVRSTSLEALFRFDWASRQGACRRSASYANAGVTAWQCHLRYRPIQLFAN